jgi:flavorubredoxin
VKKRKITDGVCWLGAVDWSRRLFDSLIPLPDGTSYNADLICGSDKTVLCKGLPGANDFASLDRLAETVTAKHAALGGNTRQVTQEREK